MNIIEHFKINGMAHITGGGLTENIPRSLPENLSVEIVKGSWDMPEIFDWLKDNGNLVDQDMFRIFNCGIGMVLIVDPKISSDVQDQIKHNGYKSYVIGKVENKASNSSVSYL